MPKKVCFCVCECAGTDIKEKTKNHEKMTKTGTRFGKVNKAGAGEASGRSEVHMVK
jgi:hypothetical protein